MMTIATATATATETAMAPCPKCGSADNWIVSYLASVRRKITSDGTWSDVIESNVADGCEYDFVWDCECGFSTRSNPEDGETDEL